MIIINLFSSTHDHKNMKKEGIINSRIIFVNVYHHQTISRNFQETLHFLKMLSAEFMQFKLYFISSDGVSTIILKSLLQQMIENNNSNVLIEQAIVMFPKKITTFQIKKEKNIDILNSSLYFRKQNMKL